MENIVERCDFRIGDIVAGQYRVQKALGEGSFGKVYLVVDSSNQRYAMKLLRLWDVPSGIRQPLMDRFEMEFKTGQIDCPYLVRAVDYGVVGGNPFIVMEFCPGGDLTSLIGTNSPRITVACKHILIGLHALHSMGKVHRDLKPENVLFKSNGDAALTDFGISGDRNRRMTERNIFGKPQQVFGTYAYMPPEQVNRARGMATVLPTTDIFSFGVLAYQLLTDHLPFGELTDISNLPSYQKRGKLGDWDSYRLKGVADGDQWIHIIDGCLRPNIKDRFQTVEEIIRLLPQVSLTPMPQYVPKQENSKGLCLKIMQGEEYNRTYSLTEMMNKGKRIIRIGREKDNDFVIRETQSSYLSRYHCLLEMAGKDQWFIRDGQWIVSEKKWRESTNGTYVNSTSISKEGILLKVGDIVTIGDVKIRMQYY